MTILFFTRLFYPHIGGVEKHVLEISKILIENGYKIIVFTEQFDSKLKLTDNIGGIEIYRIPVGKNEWFKKFKIWFWLLLHQKLIKKADIVHVHDVFFWYLPFRFLYFLKPVYTTFHGYEGNNLPSKRSIFMHKLAEKFSWGNICVGNYIRKWYGTKPMFVIYGGINLNKTQSSSVKLKIIFIGRLDEDMGISIYLKALEVLKNRKIDFRFEALGDGSLRKSVEQYGKVYGFVKDLNQYIQKADMVFASSYLSILEAMMYKKLVFAVYDNPLKEDYLKMAPFAKWIVIEDSSEKLAGKIEYFIQHREEKEKNVNKVYEWIKTQTWQKTVDTYLALWRLKVPDRRYDNDMGSL